MATRTKKNNNNSKAYSFFRLNLNVYINVEKRRRATVRNKKQRGPISLEEKHENFIAAVRNEKCKRPPNKVKMSCSEKKK